VATELPDAAPVGDADGKPFWASCARHAMELQRCDDCGAFRYPPRGVCPQCLSADATWTPVGGTGTVYVALAVHPRGVTPYSLALIELDEGVRLWSNVIDAPPDAVRIGDRVRIAYVDGAGGALPRFTRCTG
jgi:uncharacterized OB-fold protein